MSTNKLVIASGNKGKIREIKQAFAHTNLILQTQEELSIKGAFEPYATFVENALAKARHVATICGLPTLSDDSGLVVPALKYAPGVYSARYSGDNATDESNNQKLLAAMQGIDNRQAYYYACIIYIANADDPTPIVAEGLWHGTITKQRMGDGGFGYDPLFLDATVGKTGAQMTLQEKNKVSHRGESLRHILMQMTKRQII